MTERRSGEGRQTLRLDVPARAAAAFGQLAAEAGVPMCQLFQAVMLELLADPDRRARMEAILVNTAPRASAAP